MNIKKLKDAESRFLKKYPGGFAHPDMVAIGKKHKVQQMVALAQESFKKRHFSEPHTIASQMVKVVSRSSMVSMFEKPKFRDMVNDASSDVVVSLTAGLKKLLHANQQKGFETMVDTLQPYKLAKWALVTIIPNYYRPDDEVFVKPTTAKGVIDYFELQGLQYKPLPSWDFYENYREAILTMKSKVDPLITTNNAAFCGFLMMSIK